jgi:plasmid stabilization system protein ParE
MRQILWDKKAVNGFRNFIEYIRENSWSRADELTTELLDKLDEAAVHPERNRPDPYKQENDGSYRAFEYKSLRIAYRFTETQIKVLRARHVRMKPEYY